MNCELNENENHARTRRRCARGWLAGHGPLPLSLPLTFLHNLSAWSPHLFRPPRPLPPWLRLRLRWLRLRLPPLPLRPLHKHTSMGMATTLKRTTAPRTTVTATTRMETAKRVRRKKATATATATARRRLTPRRRQPRQADSRLGGACKSPTAAPMPRRRHPSLPRRRQRQCLAAPPSQRPLHLPSSAVRSRSANLREPLHRR